MLSDTIFADWNRRVHNLQRHIVFFSSEGLVRERRIDDHAVEVHVVIRTDFALSNGSVSILTLR